MIDLTAARQQVTEPELIDFGFEQEPFLGGPTQRIDRVGSRHKIAGSLPKMDAENSRRWVARLMKAKREGAFMVFPQPRLDVGAPGNPVVAAETVGGLSLPIIGATPNYAIREGQWLNVTTAGRRYLYCCEEQVILDSAGAGSVRLNVPLRKAAAAGDTVNLGKPVIEGRLDGNGYRWSIQMGMTEGLPFSIKEIA